MLRFLPEDCLAELVHIARPQPIVCKVTTISPSTYTLMLQKLYVLFHPSAQRRSLGRYPHQYSPQNNTAQVSLSLGEAWSMIRHIKAKRAYFFLQLVDGSRASLHDGGSEAVGRLHYSHERVERA